MLEDDTATTEQPSRKKIKLSSKRDGTRTDDQVAKLLKESINANEKILEQDEDRHFFLSLLGDFKSPRRKKNGC
jgi:hypothetical protein